MMRKMFIEIRLCNLLTYIFKGHVKIVKIIYMVKFNVSILNRLKIMGFFLNTEYIHKHNVIFNKTVTKLVTILTKYFFLYLNPTSYLRWSISDLTFFHRTMEFRRLFCHSRISLICLIYLAKSIFLYH